jgi:hypothetical protein
MMMMTNTLSFDDIFHELNDDLDIEANEWPYLNNFYLNFEDEIQNAEELNRTNTSQRQQHHHHHRFFYDIPDYLSVSSSSFRTAFFSELRSLYNPIKFQDLQQLAILTHQLSIIRLHQQLWYCFLQSGKGQLKQPVQPLSRHPTDFTTLSFWPKIVTSVMISKGIIHHINSQDKIDQDIYINFVQNYLHQLEKQANQCQRQFDIIKKCLPDYVDTELNDKIDHFIQKEESIMAMRLHVQTRIALLEYISIDRSYQWAHFQQKPTNLQV